ncbi:glycosyltransferase [Polaribacter sp.]|nr:glycosyltransferase [Polaribacter sp.]
MKNILLISNLYPNKYSIYHTHICHSFVKEWSKKGYNVTVIQTKSVFPNLYYRLASIFKSIATTYVGSDKLDKFRLSKPTDCLYDDVNVHVIPLFKYIPHSNYSSRTLDKTLRQILDKINDSNFTPDIILGHFINPQLNLVRKLKESFPNSITSVVIHEKAELISKSYKVSELRSLINHIDFIGFRSVSLLNSFEKLYFKVENSFINYSGIPNYFLLGPPKRNFNNKSLNIIFVGQFIKRKYPSIILDSIFGISENINKIKYIGSGSEEINIRNSALDLGLHKKIEIINDIPRTSIIDYYDEADLFIMISKGEAYGLVYLEAMSRGCITIGSINEGIDGVIVDGFNGFLAKAGDSKSLSNTISKISQLSDTEIRTIQQNAINTSRKYTDETTSLDYLNKLKK